MRWLLTLCCAVSLAAADTFVVAVGVEQYDDPQIAPLRYAAADARAVADAFRAGGVPADQVILLHSGATDRTALPTKFNLLHSLQRVREKARAEDTLIFFFAGHGMQTGPEAYLLTIDSVRENLADTALPMTAVQGMMSRFEARRILFIIDACRNDPNAGRAEADAVLDETFARSLRPVLERTGGPLPDAALLLACQVGERAWEMPDEQHGAFTWFLLRGLAGEVRDTDGAVRLQPLADYLLREVPAWAKRAGREQTPHFDNPTGGDFVVLGPTLPAVQGPERPVTGPPVAVGGTGAPAGWPDYLAGFTPPEGLTWADFRVHGPDAMPQVRVRGGTFVMGSRRGDAFASSDEMPPKEVTVADFWMDLHEVTNAQFAAFCAATERRPNAQFARWAEQTAPNLPAVQMSWDEAAAYAAWAGRALPTEAQWEYAARAGTSTAFPWGDRGDPSFGNGTWTRQEAALDDLALERTKPVCSYAPSTWGLFDLVGNVREWCRDVYQSDWYERMPAENPLNESPGLDRSTRGGAWCDTESFLRPAWRSSVKYDQGRNYLGFRCVGE